MKTRLLLVLPILAACSTEAPPPEVPSDTAAAAPAGPSPVALTGCPAADSLLAAPGGPESQATLEAARAPTDSRERRAARLSVARAVMRGEQGFTRDARRAFCLMNPLYDAGVLAVAGDLGDLHRDAGELERAAQLYGLDFGSGYVEDRARPVRGSLPEVGASHRAWVRMHALLEANPERRDALERAFREGARAGYGQERTARDTTAR
jgi:hypothetical protein